MSALNLNNFKLLKEDNTHYHLQSEKGKPFKIEKNKLSDKAHKTIKGTCYMADGGMTPSQPTLDQMSTMSLPPQNQSTGTPAQPESLGDSLASRFQEPIDIHKPVSLDDIDDMTKNIGVPAGTVEKGAAQKILPLIQNALTNASRGMEALPLEHQYRLMGAGEQVAHSLLDNLDNSQVKNILESKANDAVEYIKSLPDLKAYAKNVQSYLRRNSSGTVSDMVQDSLKKRYFNGGDVKEQKPYLDQGVYSEAKITKEDSDPVGDKANNEVLKSYSKRTGDDKGTDLREQMLTADHFYDGGEEDGPSMSDMISKDEDNEAKETTDQPSDSLSSGLQFQNSLSTTDLPASSQQTSPLDLYAQYNKDVLSQGQALSANQGKAAKEFGDLYTKQSNLPTQQDIVDKYAAKDKELSDAVLNNKLDSNRLWSKADTGNKIAAGIGIILSGMGSGLTGQPNLALKVVNDAIDRDIESQKNDQSKNYNLWKMNRERLGSDLAANLATKNQYVALAQAKAMQLASESGSSSALYNAKIAVDQSNISQAQRRDMLSLVSPTSDSTGGADPNTEQATVNHLNKLSQASVLYKDLAPEAKRQRELYIPGVGNAQIAPTAQQRDHLVNLNNIDDLVNKAINFREQYSGALGAWSPDTKAKGNAINEGLKREIPVYVENLRRSGSPEMADRIEKSFGGDINSTDLFGGSLDALKSSKNIFEGQKANLLDGLKVKPFTSGK